VITKILLNKNGNRLLGASLFLNSELIRSFVDENSTYLNIEVEQVAEGILIRPLKSMAFP